MRSAKQAAVYIIDRLLQEGFIIQRYDSRSSKSIYIKMDYGASHSLRISDHHGKKHLKYRFNLLTNLNEYFRRDEREYFALSEVDKLINAIILHRKTIVEQCGSKVGYRAYAAQYYRDSINNQGFWQYAKRIKRGYGSLNNQKMWEPQHESKSDTFTVGGTRYFITMKQTGNDLPRPARIVVRKEYWEDVVGLKGWDYVVVYDYTFTDWDFARKIYSMLKDGTPISEVRRYKKRVSQKNKSRSKR